MNADGLSWQKTAKHFVFPQFMFHLAAEKRYESAGFVHSAPSRAELFHVQEIFVCVRTLEFAGLALEYIYLFICSCSSAGFVLQHEDYAAL